MRPVQLSYLLILAAALSSAPAFAVFKCETNGRVMYSDKPCAGAKVTELKSAPILENEDALSAQKRAAAEKSQAERIDKAHAADEARERKLQQARSRIAERHRKECSLLERHLKWREEDVERAAKKSPKAEDKARLAARRAHEKFETTCK